MELTSSMANRIVDQEGALQSGRINQEQVKLTQDMAEMVEGVKRVGNELSRLANAL